MCGLGCHGSFKDQIILRVSQVWSPHKVNLVMAGDSAKVIQNGLGARCINTKVLTLDDVFILKHQRHGNTHCKQARVNQRQ